MVIPRPLQAFPGDLDAGKDFALSLGEASVITGNFSGSGLGWHEEEEGATSEFFLFELSAAVWRHVWRVRNVKAASQVEAANDPASG